MVTQIRDETKKDIPSQMEIFKINKSWRFREAMGCMFPLIFLMGILALYIFIIVPSRGEAFEFEFKNNIWTGLVVVGLVIWTVLAGRKYIKAMNFYVGLAEDVIQVNNDLVSWIDISKVEYKTAFGNDPAIVLYTKTGKIVKIPAVIEALAYIKGFIESHTRHILQSNN